MITHSWWVGLDRQGFMAHFHAVEEPRIVRGSRPLVTIGWGDWGSTFYAPGATRTGLKLAGVRLSLDERRPLTQAFAIAQATLSGVDEDRLVDWESLGVRR